jgi:type II restriction/modification system DNA methylase subunit YeeA
MNRTKLKNYAPQARKDFIQAVTAKAAQYGLTASKIEPMTEKGDVVLIAGKPFPKSVGDKRKRLEERIMRNGFEQTMEAMAYTWFNRLVAIRYMELHGYLEHGFRVLSHPQDQTQPEILEKAQYVDLPALDQKKVVELKLDGTKEEELYRLLLTAQFNALSKAMPFLFEKIDDETELLLPDSLLNSDSLIRKLVTEIDEEDWKEVEIIGWLYQFYISDKKDEVIGKVVKSEDIPAATQLFTPNWIVKYLVQNTIGRQWLATYPQSSLRSRMEYYIEPAEQTPEVQEQLKAITPTSLNPEELTLLDPACGSGHILVEAYDLFKAIYEERGYRSKDIPALILQKNLFGLEIDDRAAQLAAFALMMKARADYPRIFDAEAKPNIVSFVESRGLDAEEIHYALMSPLPTEKETAEPPRPDGFLFETENNLFTHAVEAKAAKTTASSALLDITKEDIAALVALFEAAKTFGSLIQVPPKLAEKLPIVAKRLVKVLANGDLTHSAARVIEPLLHQAVLLARRYDAVVANPPYMGSKGMNPVVKEFAKRHFSSVKPDLFACFIERAFPNATKNGSFAMVTMQSWMFLASYEALRNQILNSKTLTVVAHLGPRAFAEISGEVVQTVAFAANNQHFAGYKPSFFRLVDGNENQKKVMLAGKQNLYSARTLEEFAHIPSSPLAYWASSQLLSAFASDVNIDRLSPPRIGMMTTDNSRFLRRWSEVDFRKIGFGFKDIEQAVKSETKWFPYNKGGGFRKWAGNYELVVNWKSGGAEIKAAGMTSFRGKDFYFREGITWSDVSTADFCCRHTPEGFIFDIKGTSSFPTVDDRGLVACIMNSKVGAYILKLLNPTMSYQSGDVRRIPIVEQLLQMRSHFNATYSRLIQISLDDWNGIETSWQYQLSPLLADSKRELTASAAYNRWRDSAKSSVDEIKQLEEQNNRLFIECFGLIDEMTPEVPYDQISLTCNPAFRYGSNVSSAGLEGRLRDDVFREFVSYAIGCAMGRYSLDTPSLIYAHSGNEGFDSTQYKTFRADDDGIIPLLESDWGIQDDAANRIFEFVSVAWPKEHLDENLKFIADSLTPTNGEQPKDTIRRYLAAGFYKHHLSMYKKRPIYWLFSSGKQKAFQCLVYLHRYNEGTLARMRTEYVIPLMGKMTARLEHLQGPPEQKGAGGEIAATSAVTVKRKLEKERDNIKKQLAELQTFDEKLRHYADLRIKLDLDDGVKVNYGKFSDPEIGDILAEVKAICGTKDED